MRICTALVLCAAGLISVSTADVQWYRTAQGNSDRLTKQSDLQFGADFSYDQVVMINRSLIVTEWAKIGAKMESQIFDLRYL